MNGIRFLSLCWTITFAASSWCQQVSASVTDIEAGRSIYNYRCYFCHGYSGDARTLAASYMAIKPTNFQSLSITNVTRQQMLEVVTHGRNNTPMVGFSRLLSEQEIADVVDFIRDEFIVNKNQNTRYHNKANGWANHDRYAIAYPFATGEIALDEPLADLSPEQQQGRQFYLRHCITCHDRGTVNNEGDYWSTQALSYPRNNYDHKNPTQHYDGVSSASVYAFHDQQPDVLLNSPYQRQGRNLYEQNCSFCHANDGTGRNWIGSFLEPRPRDFNEPEFMSSVNKEFLIRRIKKGIPDTSMPAWESVLTEHEIASIVTYMHIAFHPVGEGN